MPGQIVIISGPPGAGKSTVARKLADGAPASKSIHLHTDDFYAYIRKGFIEPWQPDSRAQNAVVLDAQAATAAIFAKGGYDVIVDGVVGPWFLAPWREVAKRDWLDLRYVVLLPSEQETIARACARTAPGAMTDAGVVRHMWKQFAELEAWRAHIVDTSGLSSDLTAQIVRGELQAGRLRPPL